MVMKRIKYIALSCIIALGMTSCSDWLDVNVDQDNPSDETALLANQLPWLEHFYLYAAGGANFNTALTAGLYYSSQAQWGPPSVTWDFPDTDNYTLRAYQCWFVYCNELPMMYSKAEAQGAYHYMAVADVLHAMGFMLMTDLYSEIPYTDAFGESATPVYDDGKTVFNGCLQKLEDAIALFSQEQEPNAPSLAEGDYLNQGNIDKWKKMCYGLKARYLLKLSKKAEFDPQGVLNALEQGPKSIADNVVGISYNKSNDVTDWLYGDQLEANCNWTWASNWRQNYMRQTKYYTDLLTNMRGAGVEDPRLSKIVPASMSNIKVDASGNVISYKWMRGQGVDVHGEATRLIEGGGARSIVQPTYAEKNTDITYVIKSAEDKETFLTNMASNNHACVVKQDTLVTVTYQQGSIFVNSTDYHVAGDTIYVLPRSNSVLSSDNGGQDETDINWYFGKAAAYNAGAVGGTGSYQIRPTSDFEVLTYHEMCFIKAEIYMRQNDKAQALAAYKEGIQAHIAMMQEKLRQWQSEGYQRNPDMLPMDEAQIAAYMNSAAVVQTAGELTMADIMLQKYLAMGCSIENWNDMRRFNYSAGNIGSFGVVYTGFDRSPLFTGAAKMPGTQKTDIDYWPRRWRLPFSLELQYNVTNAEAMNPNATKVWIWSVPVWWDCATDEEYYGYGITRPAAE
jgi:hypothetical protein